MSDQAGKYRPLEGSGYMKVGNSAVYLRKDGRIKLVLRDKIDEEFYEKCFRPCCKKCKSEFKLVEEQMVCVGCNHSIAL